ncbi:methyl-accepting chemotaxis protein [Proteinivorax tanatarense]|uniref:Methyl-accepting chemotaxis protein n=1 Tax=Proteinivorax tanatarense TaxID=1260629 RepID=A0AAU7VJT6_9FIRM
MQSIKFKLIALFSIICSLVFIVSGIILYNVSSSELTRLSEDLSSDITENSADAVGSLIEQNLSELAIITEYDAVKEMDIEDSKRFLQKAENNTLFTRLSIVHPDGTAFSSNGEQGDFSASAYMEPIFQQGQHTYVTNPFESSLDGQLITVFAHSITNFDGEVVGLISGSVLLQDLTSAVDQINIEGEGFGWVVDGTGDIIVHRNDSRIGESVTDSSNSSYLGDNLDKIMSNDNGVIRTDIEGVDSYLLFSNIDNTHDWKLFIQIPRSTLLSGLQLFTRIFVIFVIGSIFTILITSYFGANYFTKPIKSLTTHAKTIADLDLSSNVPNNLLERKDEIGSLSKSLQLITENFKETINKIKGSSHTVQSYSEDLTSSAKDAAQISKEVSSATQQIAMGASSQATDTEDGSIKASNLGNLIEQNQDHIKNVSNFSSQVSSAVKEGLDKVQELTQISNESNQEVQEVHSAIVQTSDSVSKISQSSQLIASIAEQTNLLALNAAIEAARAGEVGKGFAVVAEEIKKLAEESTSSTKTIDEVVTELQSNSKKSVESMEKVENILSQQSNIVSITKDKYSLILDAIKTTEVEVQNLSTSGSEMEKMKNDILNTLQNLSAVAEENSASTEEVSASMEQNNSSIEKIQKSSLNLEKIAKDMNENVTKFNL